MSENSQAANLLTFKRFNNVFWFIWACMPFLFYTIWQLVNNPETYVNGLTPQQIACMTDIIDPSKFSTPGWLLYNLPVISGFGFLMILVFCFHRMVRRFANGSAFDALTLRDMKILGYTLLGFPIFEFILGHIVSELLQQTGDLKASNPPPFIDVTTIAAGFFVIALMIVLKNAIDLKSENDLTI